MTAVIRLLKTARDHIAGPSMFWPGRYYKGRPDTIKFVDVPDIPCCPLGALGYAANCSPEDYANKSGAHRTAQRELYATLRKQGGESVPGFSDTPGRTQAEIVNLFDDTIKRLEATA